MNFIFPTTRFVRENSPGDQLMHVLEEIREVLAIAEGQYEDLEEAMKDDRLREELNDLRHSLETLTRVEIRTRVALAVRHDRQQVIEKNAARGYYIPGEF